MSEIGRTPLAEALARVTAGLEGARFIGTQIAGIAGTNLQTVLEGLKTLVDTKLDANDATVTNQRVPTDESVTNAKVAPGAAIQESKLQLASDAAAATASRRTLGTGATQAAAGNDGRLSDTRTPTDATVTPAKFHADAKDPAANVAGARTLGTGAQQAAAGNDGRLSDQRTPTDSSVTLAKIASAIIDAAANVASLRTLGTGAQQAAAGNDARLSDTRTPTDGSVTLVKIAAAIIDAAAGTASLRTLGTGATQAAPGNHQHTSQLPLAFAFSGTATPRESNPARIIGSRTIKRVSIDCGTAPVGTGTIEVRVAGVAVTGGSINFTAKNTVTADLNVAVADLALMTVAILNGGATTPAEKVTVTVEMTRGI